MATECREDELRFQGLGARQVTGAFDGGTLSSDGGALLLRELEERRRIVERFARIGFEDRRDPERIELALETLCKQRIFGICLGYEDLIDHDELRRDVLLALSCGAQEPEGKNRRREQDRGAPLAGKSTLQRLEATPLGAGPQERYHKIVCSPRQIEQFIVQLAIEQHEKRPPARIVLDIDPSDIELHGQKQEQRFYNTHYGHDCYLPMYIFWGKSVVTALLRPSNIDVMCGLLELLEDVLTQLRKRYPTTPVLLRADSAFAREELLAWVEKRKAEGEKLDYLFGLPSNTRLQAAVEPLKQRAAQLFQSGSPSVRLFSEFQYSTLESWTRERRVIAKAEHTQSRTHQHFLVTSLPRRGFSPSKLYEEQYCPRGEAENRIKEQQLDLFGTRTSAITFNSNQLRLWFSAIAYALMNELRSEALAGTELADAQASTIRTKLLKVGTIVRHSVRRIRLSLPSSYAWQGLFATALSRLQLLEAVELRC